MSRNNFKMKLIGRNGITLIALIVTIIVLLILAGISISMLTGNNGILNKATEAAKATETAGVKEQIQLAVLDALTQGLGKIESTESLDNSLQNYVQKEYNLDGDPENGWTITVSENEVSFQVNGNGEIKEVEINWIQNPDGSITNKDKTQTLQIGQYVNYNPTSVSQTDDSYTQLISMLGEENSGSANNTLSTITQETLQWRILDLENGKIRLISATPTESKIELYSYQGYNNGVYLIDQACKVLYSNSELASTVQNLKEEDIVKYLVTKPIYDTKLYSPPTYNYPSILEQEEEQTIDGVTQPTTRLGRSEQYELANPNSKKVATSWNLKNTATPTGLSSSMNESMFSNPIYFNLFFNGNFWLSTRAVFVAETGNFANFAQFDLKRISSNSYQSRCTKFRFVSFR